MNAPARIPSTRLARDLARVTRAFSDYHGVSASALSRMLLGDSRFLPAAVKSASTGAPFAFASATYDRAMGHLVLLWPDELRWPDGVWQPIPLDFDDDAKLPEIRHRLERAMAAKQRKESENG